MTIRLMIIGDVVGAPGIAMVQKYLPKLKAEHSIDGIIVNGENAADGKGVTPRIMKCFQHIGVDLVTSGNHIWYRREIYPYLDAHDDLLRPANFPSSSPGKGVGLFKAKDVPVGVINIQGRVFMREFVGCPLKTVETSLTYLRSKTKIIILDVHAETTSEKTAIAFYFDGKVSAVVGTHTHVQTADERILPEGTAFITDLGMCGTLNSVIGVKKEAILYNMQRQMPTRFTLESKPPYILSGVIVAIDSETGAARSIERLRIIDSSISLNE